MPAQFDAFGIRFLYPDNWKIADRPDEEGDRGTTFDLPSGGFVSLEKTRAEEVEPLVERIVDAIAADYEDLERETISLEGLPADAHAIDLRFYYLDLLVISRLVVLQLPRETEVTPAPADTLLADVPTAVDPSRQGAPMLVLQMQAESRDFDQNEPVFRAILKQITDSMA
ncbi:hypothetical protein FYK55_08550 [Roseiconus nitratireducens]|uniref:Uncharacterized protein n=1 Tax=Roseiconus nitratireducens TaxID=2605748 RepID=A0A5M6DGM6_9BACT|nr:hypothetical protein [Roseiconus nitratireducens]KAA5544385.1 hypothetical protein FYK55_08550 [Roseiconus nitratireducens]